MAQHDTLANSPEARNDIKDIYSYIAFELLVPGTVKGPFALKGIEIFLRSNFPISLVIIIPAFCVHIVYHSNSRQVEIPDGDAELYAAEQK